MLKLKRKRKAHDDSIAQGRGGEQACTEIVRRGMASRLRKKQAHHTLQEVVKVAVESGLRQAARLEQRSYKGVGARKAKRSTIKTGRSP